MITDKIQDFIIAIPKVGKIMSIDFGTKRIGLAISTVEQSMSMPLNTITSGIDGVLKCIAQHDPCGVVIGMPLNMDGTKGAQWEMVQKFAEKIASANIPILLQDERLTSRAAHSLLRQHNFKRSKRDAMDDAVAACLILDTALDLIRTI